MRGVRAPRHEWRVPNNHASRFAGTFRDSMQAPSKGLHATLKPNHQ